MALLDAKDLKDGAVLSADLCIVGSGPAGMTLATELADSGLDIVLLESGGLDYEDDVQLLNDGRMTGIDTWSTRDMRIRQLGGTSNHWTGFCRPLSREDFERRGWIEGSGWPIDYDTLVPFYLRAHKTCEVGVFDYDARKMSERVGVPLLTDDDSVLEHTFYRRSPPTRFGGKKFRPSIEAAENVRLYVHATLLDIRLDSALRAVERLDCATLDGSRFSVEAGRYVLALGGLENPRMLLASSNQLDQGVANASGLVGCRFMEHPHYYYSVAMVVRDSAKLEFYGDHLLDESDVGGPEMLRILGSFGLSADVRAAEGLLNMSVTLTSRDIETARTGPISPLKAAAIQGLSADESILMRLTCRTEQSPYELSRITLGGKSDVLGMRRLELDWRIREEDNRALRRAFEIIGSELGRLGIGRIWTPHRDGRFDWKPNPGGHHMGATLMGDDADKSVVDANLRCHDTHNLYVVGGSVFVTSGDANPTLTIVALAHRLADHLRGDA